MALNLIEDILQKKYYENAAHEYNLGYNERFFHNIFRNRFCTPTHISSTKRRLDAIRMMKNIYFAYIEINKSISSKFSSSNIHLYLPVSKMTKVFHGKCYT